MACQFNIQIVCERAWVMQCDHRAKLSKAWTRSCPTERPASGGLEDNQSVSREDGMGFGGLACMKFGGRTGKRRGAGDFEKLFEGRAKGGGDDLLCLRIGRAGKLAVVPPFLLSFLLVDSAREEGGRFLVFRDMIFSGEVQSV